MSQLAKGRLQILVIKNIPFILEFTKTQLLFPLQTSLLPPLLTWSILMIHRYSSSHSIPLSRSLLHRQLLFFHCFTSLVTSLLTILMKKIYTLAQFDILPMLFHHIKGYLLFMIFINIFWSMTKFFIPIPRGAPKGFAHPPKQKKSGNCVETLHKKMMGMLKRLLVRQTQKTIRKLHEETDEQAKKKLVARLEQYKGIKKSELKVLSQFSLMTELNVEAEALKKHFKVAPPKDHTELPKQVQSFYEAIKSKNLYQHEVEDAQKIHNQVSEKKKIKKEKAKMKKKTKLAVKKEQGVDDKQKKQKIEGEEESQMVVEDDGQISEKISSQDKSNDQPQGSVAKVISQRQNQPKIDSKKKTQKTQFKKTGRNKFLQEKRNQKKGHFKQQQQEPSPIISNRPPIPNRNQTPHPSWQAKREIKNQMFLQPFQGKRILL